MEPGAEAQVDFGQGAWVAVDGKPAPIWRANYAFQALQIPAGRHTLTLVYKDSLFRAGMILAVLAGLVCAVLWFGPGRCLGKCGEHPMNKQVKTNGLPDSGSQGRKGGVI
jgi:hypothetical protein